MILPQWTKDREINSLGMYKIKQLALPPADDFVLYKANKRFLKQALGKSKLK